MWLLFNFRCFFSRFLSIVYRSIEIRKETENSWLKDWNFNSVFLIDWIWIEMIRMNIMFNDMQFQWTEKCQIIVNLKWKRKIFHKIVEKLLPEVLLAAILFPCDIWIWCDIRVIAKIDIIRKFIIFIRYWTVTVYRNVKKRK